MHTREENVKWLEENVYDTVMRKNGDPIDAITSTVMKHFLRKAMDNVYTDSDLEEMRNLYENTELGKKMIEASTLFASYLNELGEFVKELKCQS